MHQPLGQAIDGSGNPVCPARPAEFSKSPTRIDDHLPISKAFTGLRPARPFSRRKRAQNALRRAHAGAAPAAPIRCASRQSQAGAELARPCALNTGAYSLRLPAMLAALYGALSHSTAHPCATCLLFRFIPERQRTADAASVTVLASGMLLRGWDGTRSMS
jgi:hypothetical protein